MRSCRYSKLIKDVNMKLWTSAWWSVFQLVARNWDLFSFDVKELKCLLDSHVWWCCRAVVVRWHSFQRGSTRPDSYLFRAVESGRGAVQGSRPLASLSCGQLLVLRKLALLKLTACMERYCPTHRTGWNWELPKFIRKIKTPDYKGELIRCTRHEDVFSVF